MGVERTFLLHSPRIDRIEVLRHGDVRRAKLFYLREKVGKRARIRERRQPLGGEAEVVRRSAALEPAAEAAADYDGGAAEFAEPVEAATEPSEAEDLEAEELEAEELEPENV